MVRDISNIDRPTRSEAQVERNRGNNAADNNVRPAQTAVEQNSSHTDSVNLSEQAQALRSAEEAIKQLPTVNEARVAEFQQKIADGQYTVDADQIAAKILSLDKLI